jgi:FtsP/CotA-like multicopper oxidase with cupredoxin domain
MSDPRINRRRFLGGSALLGVAAVLGPAGLAALRRIPPPGGPDLAHAGQVAHVHPAHPTLPMPRYVTTLERRRTPAGVPYLEAVARRVDA